jgi:hypothetical protein
MTDLDAFLRRIDRELAAGAARIAWQVSYHLSNFRPAGTTLGALLPSAQVASGPWRPQRHAEVLLQAGFLGKLHCMTLWHPRCLN